MSLGTTSSPLHCSTLTTNCDLFRSTCCICLVSVCAAEWPACSVSAVMLIRGWKTMNPRMGALMTCHIWPVIQMKCTSCYQSCQRALPTLVPNALNAIRLSGGQRWRGSFRAAFATSSPHCSTPTHPHTCYATDRLDTRTAASSSLGFQYKLLWFISILHTFNWNMMSWKSIFINSFSSFYGAALMSTIH